MDESRRGTLAEATDVIGSQSRQEGAAIKHNRYAWVRACAVRKCKTVRRHRDRSTSLPAKAVRDGSRGAGKLHQDMTKK